MKPLAYFQGVLSELRKVTWPTFPVLVRYFFSVVIGIALGTLLIGAMDFLFIKILGLVIK